MAFYLNVVIVGDDAILIVLPSCVTLFSSVSGSF